LNQGYTGSIANNEVLYMILEGAMMIIAAGALTFGHPGRTLGSVWQANAFHFRQKKSLNQDNRDQGKETA
jgi:hypothetical protein